MISKDPTLACNFDSSTYTIASIIASLSILSKILQATRSQLGNLIHPLLPNNLPNNTSTINLYDKILNVNEVSNYAQNIVGNTISSPRRMGVNTTAQPVPFSFLQEHRLASLMLQQQQQAQSKKQSSPPRAQHSASLKKILYGYYPLKHCGGVPQWITPEHVVDLTYAYVLLFLFIKHLLNICYTFI